MKKRILTLMLFSILMLAFVFVAASCGAAGKLSKPTDISYDGNVITWAPVEGAEKYHVQINDLSEISTVGTAYSYPTPDAQFTVSVTAISGKKKSAVATHTFIPLGRVGEITVADNGDLSWDAVANAGEYVLSIDGTEKTVYTTEYKELTAGAHGIKIKASSTAVAEGTTYFAQWSNEKNVTVCQDVSGDSVAYDPTDRQLVWGAVTGASEYKVTISGVGISKSETVKTPYYSFDAEMRDFTVEIQAIGDHKTTFDSKGVASRTLVYLEPVTNLRVIDGELLWDGSEGASAYRLKVNGKPQAQLLTECKAGGFPVNLPITVSILPTSDDTVYFSSWSADFSFTVLPAPVLKWNNLALDGEANNNIFWDAVNGAGGYTVKVTHNGVEIDTATLAGEVRAYSNAYLAEGEYVVTVKSTAPSIGSTNVSDSAYSAPMKILRLPAPKLAGGDSITSDPNDTSEGFTVTFTPVSGATQYRIWKDDAQYATLAGDKTQYTDRNVLDPNVITAQQYTYVLQSIGRNVRTEAGGAQSVVLDSIKGTSTSFTIDVLPAPTNPIMEGFNLKYDAVTGAYGYVISTGSGTYPENTTSCNLSILTSGVYSIGVAARGNGGSTLSSNYTPPISVTRLAAPTNIKIMTNVGDDGKLTFDEVMNTRSYDLVIRGVSEPITITYKTNIKEHIKTDGTYLHIVAVANYYRSDDPTTRTYYMTSPDSETKMFTKLAMPSFGEKPFANGALNWNAPSNIRTDAYTPTYQVYNAQNILQNVTVNGTTMSLSTLEAGDYSFRVMAIGDGVSYINSDMNSDTPTKVVTKLKTPDVKVDTVNGVYTWGAVPSAQNYAVYVDGELQQTDLNEAGGIFSFKPSFTSEKNYRVTVQAIGDGGIDYIDSSEFVIVQRTDTLDPPSFTWSYGADYYTPSAKLTLTVTEGPELATGYFFTYEGTTYETTETSCSQSVHASGSIYCTVYARGGVFDEHGVYWIDSPATPLEITLLDEPGTVTVDTYGTMEWGPSGNASAYLVSVEYNGQTYNTRVSNAKCELLELLDLLALPKSGTLKISITAVGTSNCIPSKPHTQDWVLG